MIKSAASRALGRPVDGWVCSSCRHSTLRPSSIYAQTRGRHSLRPNRRYHSRTASSTQTTTHRDGRLPDSPARTRFAPSPTGYMHIGGLRTALFSYLLAKRTKGQFLLRIEDTDQKRLVRDAESRLCEDLQWAGLQWDEGPQANGPYGPYRQSDRTHIYQQHAHGLLDAGAAYRCFCTPQTTGIGGGKAAYVTSGCYQDCASLRSDQAQERADDKKEPFTIRLRQPADVHKRTYKDLVYGRIQRLKRSPSASQGDEDDAGIDTADTILVKTDGTPTYHFANVVDDHLMRITHVIRGSEWMASTPLHYDLYTAFGWQPPVFAHVGLLVDENKAKLSKRSNTGLVLDVRGMREQEGVLPEVLCNFLALLGWSNPGRNDVLEMDDLIRDFDLKFTKGNTVVRMEKLWFLQKQHVAQRCELASSAASLKPIADVVGHIQKAAQVAFPGKLGYGASGAKSLEAYCADMLLTDSKSYQTPQNFVERNRYFFAFDPCEVPVQQQFYDKNKNISGDSLAEFTRHLLGRFDWKQPYRPNPFAREASTSTVAEHDRKGLLSAVEQASAQIHAGINLEIWTTICAMSKTGSEDSPLDGVTEALPYTPDPVDLEACAQHISALRFVAGTSGEKDAAEIVKQYKEWNKAVMRYLREKLSYGLPGPGVGAIMALLGYEECCRRLAVEPQTTGGW